MSEMQDRGLDQISYKLGELSAALNSHIRASEEDRELAARDRRDMAEKLDRVERTVEAIPPLAARVTSIEPEVRSIANLRAKLALVAGIVGGACALALEGLRQFGPEFISLLKWMTTKH